MSVPKGKRNLSRFEAQHHFYKLRDEITALVLNDFGFAQHKQDKKMEHYKEAHKCAENLDEVMERWKTKNETFIRWFIDEEGKMVLALMRQIEREFTAGNSIYPSETPAKLFEFIERRKHMNNAIGLCYTLKQEIHYIIRTLPVDLNRYTHFAEAIDEQIALYKGVRQSDNRLLKTRSPKTGQMVYQSQSVFDIIATVMMEIGKAENK